MVFNLIVLKTLFRILTLTGHHAEIWSLSVSNNGCYLVSGSHDKTLRLWRRSEDEVVVLEDEREMEREKEIEQQLATAEQVKHSMKSQDMG